MKITSWEQIKTIVRSMGNTLLKNIADTKKEAMAAADKAQKTADRVQKTADRAQETAENAQTTATNAQKTAITKMEKNNPIGTGFFSMNAAVDSTPGQYSHTEGEECIASGRGAHAEGKYAEAVGSYSHAEGDASVASGDYSHAEGFTSTASGECSHAEGDDTKASGNFSHAEGFATEAAGSYTHAEGFYTVASGESSHAEGHGTKVVGSYSHVQGKYNIVDTEGKYAHIVGNGKSSLNKHRSNAHTLDWNGNAWFAGDVYVGGTSQDNGEKLVTESEMAAAVSTKYKQPDWGVEESDVVLPETEIAFDPETGEGALTNPLLTDLVVGETYSVYVNGEMIALCVAKTVTAEMGDMTVLSNFDVENGLMEGVEKPFMFAQIPAELANEMGMYAMFMLFGDGVTSATLQIKKVKNVYKIPKEYIVQNEEPLYLEAVYGNFEDGSLGATITNTTYEEIYSAVKEGRQIIFRMSDENEVVLYKMQSCHIDRNDITLYFASIGFDGNTIRCQCVTVYAVQGSTIMGKIGFVGL